MRVGILGTGPVGRRLAGKLVEQGNEVMLGTRDVAASMARTEALYDGGPPLKVWQVAAPI